MALLTRYHRRGTPKKSHAGYSDLPSALRKSVRILSGFLRLAETLDRSRNGVVRKIEVQDRAGKLTMNVYAVGDSELEVWAANRHLPSIAETLQRSVKIVAHHMQEPDEGARQRSRKRRRTQPAATGKSAATAAWQAVH